MSPTPIVRPCPSAEIWPTTNTNGPHLHPWDNGTGMLQSQKSAGMMRWGAPHRGACALSIPDDSHPMANRRMPVAALRSWAGNRLADQSPPGTVTHRSAAVKRVRDRLVSARDGHSGATVSCSGPGWRRGNHFLEGARSVTDGRVPPVPDAGRTALHERRHVRHAPTVLYALAAARGHMPSKGRSRRASRSEPDLLPRSMRAWRWSRTCCSAVADGARSAGRAGDLRQRRSLASRPTPGRPRHLRHPARIAVRSGPPLRGRNHREIG